MEQQIVKGTIQNPPASFEITLGAYEILPVFYAFDYFRVTEGTYARGDVEYRFSDTGQPATYVNGQGVRLTEVVGRVTLTNKTDSPITLTIDIGIGNISDDRLAASGTLLVTNPSGETLSTEDIRGAAILNMMQNDSAQRVGLTTLNTASYALIDGATTTVVSSGSNTSGVIIRVLSWVYKTGENWYVQIGSSRLIDCPSSSVNAGGSLGNIKDIFVPSGEQIIVSCSGGATVTMAYEVL